MKETHRIQARDAANVGRTHEESIVSWLYAMISDLRLKKACSRDG